MKSKFKNKVNLTDVAIARDILGLELWPGEENYFKAKFVATGSEPKPCIPNNYSSDLSAAWTIVEKMKDNGFSLHLISGIADTYNVVRFTHWNGSYHCADRGSVPELICRAALSWYKNKETYED